MGGTSAWFILPSPIEGSPTRPLSKGDYPARPGFRASGSHENTHKTSLFHVKHNESYYLGHHQ